LLKSAQQKAPGPDDIAIELLQFGGEMTLNKLHEICTEVWETGIWPEEWTLDTVFIQLPKMVICYSATTTGPLHWFHTPARY